LKDLKIIGSEEWCSFKTFGIPAIKARVDSGAKTSSIQANKIKTFYKDTENWVRFHVNPIQDNRSIDIICEAKIFATRTVKSSMGITEERIVIETPITIDGDTFNIKLTLANRDSMEFRMLLGREALNHRFLVKFANSPLDTKDLIKMVNGAPLIIKLLESTQGKGVVLAETNKAAESVINAFKSVKTNILVQEFIKEANGQDIRCFVVNGKVVASMQRQAAKGEFRANIHQGGSASKIKITADERKLAIKAAKILDLPVAGVDIIRSNKGPLLLEVNSSPGLEGIENATGLDIANIMIEAIEKKLKFKN